MAKMERYRKQAKLLARWDEERNYSVGEKLRLIPRYQHLTDVEVLDMPMPLTLAQEVVAVEAGFASWAERKQSVDNVAMVRNADTSQPTLSHVTPILFVRDVACAADFYAAKLGFEIDFLHGKPPFYGAVSRGRACLHLRHVGEPNFAALAQREPSLILATIEVLNVKALYAEYENRGAVFAQKLVQQAWGGLDFQVRDPDGNTISFVEYRRNC